MRLYDLYMKEYRDAAYREMCEYKNIEFVEESNEDVFDESGKEGVYKIAYYLQDHLQIPYIRKALNNKQTKDALIDFVGRFIDQHQTQLSTMGPVYKFTFNVKESEWLYNLFGVTKEQILQMYNEMINETYYGKISKFFNGWIESAPHKLLLCALLIEAIQKNDTDIIECCEYMLVFSEYAIIYSSFWKTGVKEDVMKYTIEHLSTKFKVKKVKTLQELLKYDVNTVVSFFIPKMKESGQDNYYLDFIQRLRNQINSTFKNISIAYYKNSELNASQHDNVTIFDDGNIANQEGISSNSSQIILRTNNKFAQKEINNKFIQICAEINQVDKNLLSGFMTEIYNTEDNKLGKIVENIIIAYFEKNRSESKLTSSIFLNWGIALYRSIGSSKDPIYKEIRDILTFWMNDIVHIRNYYQREATVIGYTRAIFNYIIFMINYYN